MRPAVSSVRGGDEVGGRVLVPTRTGREAPMRWAVVAATMAVTLITATAGLAQVRTGDEGRAAEANNRVGSGGYNTPRPNLQLASPNDIALGNVTSGRGFRSNITPDPTQPFGGRSNLPSDRFARASNPVTPGGVPTPVPGAVQQYYSTSPVGIAPAGYILNPVTGRYQPTPGIRAGGLDIDYNTPPGTPVIRPQAGGTDQLVLPAMLRDETGALSPSVLTATPLLGLRLSSDLSDQDQYLLSRSLDPRKGGAGEIDAATLRKLREELRETLRTDPRLAQKFREAESRVQDEQAARTSPLQGATDVTAQPLGASVRRDVTGRAPGATPLTKDPAGGLGTSPATEQPGVGVDGQLPGAERTSPEAFNDTTGPQNQTRNRLLAELRRNEQARREAAARRNAEKGKGAPGGTAPNGIQRGGSGSGGAGSGGAGSGGVRPAPVPGGAGGNDAAAGSPQAAGNAPTSRPAGVAGGIFDGSGIANRENLPVNQGPTEVGYVPPVRVASLAEAQSSQGLKQLLAGGEELLRQGRYASAADRFEAAGQFAPGDATVTVAKAHAELAAGFFARAEASLRGAFTADPAVLNAQYDLRKAVGDARVDQLVADLKRIATQEKTSATPVLLLAYLAFNSGSGERASDLLAEAAARRPGDPLIEAMRDRWTAPSGGAGEGNK